MIMNLNNLQHMVVFQREGKVLEERNLIQESGIIMKITGSFLWITSNLTVFCLYTPKTMGMESSISFEKKYNGSLLINCIENTFHWEKNEV